MSPFPARPRVICHMMSSLDGRIDPQALRAVVATEEYESAGSALPGNAWLCGRTTLQKDFADYLEPEPFRPPPTAIPAGPTPVHVARQASSFAIAADTLGQIVWRSSHIGDDHIIALVSEQAPADYLDLLRSRGVSFIVAGVTALDLPQALALLTRHFDLHTLLLEGGGHINGAFASAGLLDEVSLLLVPGIDGRPGIPTVFDGRSPDSPAVLPLVLQSVQQRDRGVLWLRYTVTRP